MDQISYKTTYVNKATAQKEWVLIDAENQVVGRIEESDKKELIIKSEFGEFRY